MRRLLLALGFALLAACSTTSQDERREATTGDGDATATSAATADVELALDRHLATAIDDLAHFDAFAATGASGNQQVKFTIVDPWGIPSVRWMDTNFFQLHDEWYWFQLANGIAVPGAASDPLDGLAFPTVDDVYAWADDGVDALASIGTELDDDGRLYSDEFYDLALWNSPRTYVAGSVVSATDADGATRWLLELEYHDESEVTELETIHAAVASALPGEISDALEWVVRSPFQDDVASAIEVGDGPLADRVVRYSDLFPAGVATVHNPGLTVGRLLLVGVDGVRLDDAADDSIVVLEHVPDELPAAAALVTSAPQTPLAHVNLLARNRGIPNVSVSGIHLDPALRQAADVGAPALVHADADGNVDLILLTDAEFDSARAVGSVGGLDITPAVPTGAVTVDLGALAAATAPAVANEIGGKAVGHVALLRSGVRTPPSAMAVTVDPYLRHLEPLLPMIRSMLEHAEFEEHLVIRTLLVEGIDEVRARFDEREVERAEAFIAANPPGGPLGELLAGGGLRRVIRDRDLDAGDLVAITSALESVFDDHDPGQGLRFRSSSTVEDVDGFNGAGLYDSNTGYRSGRPDRTIEWALKKTWASYWNIEAVEERRAAGIDHLDGAMAVLVHARFDDSHELSNGVATVTLHRDPARPFAEVEINAQGGAESVTNPDPSSAHLPEVISVDVAADGRVSIDRRQASTFVPGDVLDDGEVRELVDALLVVADHWSDEVNAQLAPERQRVALVLDVEFKTMAPGWPAGDASADGLVLKQVRSLEPGLAHLPEQLRDLTAPVDIVSRATRIESECVDGTETLRIWTDPLILPDVGHGETPFETAIFQPEGCAGDFVFRTGTDFLRSLLESSEGIRIVG